jgi:biotin synthase
MNWSSAIMEPAGKGEPVTADVALAVLQAPPEDLPELLAASTTARRRAFGDRIHLCSVVNAKSGACSEDCAFCAQSSVNAGGTRVFGLLSKKELGKAYDEASRLPIRHFGVVTSGACLDDKGIDRVAEAVRESGLRGPLWCASLGSLDGAGLARLKEAGLRRFHHNLETAESFFPNICSTHKYADRLATVRAAKKAGLEICCGGILGLGETLGQRVELATAIAAEKVDSIPLNFLIPIPGTRLEHLDPLSPFDILKCIVMFRLTNPQAEIEICGGRCHLAEQQSLIFAAGANGMMIGPLLTTAGSSSDEDLLMIRNLSLQIDR